MIDLIVKLVKDWRIAVSLLVVIALGSWIRPDKPEGLFALALIVFAAVFLGAAASSVLRRPPPDDDVAAP